MNYNKKTFRAEFLNLCDEKYQEFSKKIAIGKLEPVGIRVPKLKELAKNLAKSNWQDFFETEENWCSEIIILKGLVLGYAKLDIGQFLNYLHQFFEMVESWTETDICAASFKIIKKNQQRVFDEILPYLYCKKEYKVRLAIIILLDYFLTDDWIDKVFRLLPQIEQGEYYVDMAIAWTLSVCFVKYREKTLDILKKKVFSKFVQNKAVQKCRESFRVSEEDKQLLQKYKLQ